jgi:hypothetical protein
MRRLPPLNALRVFEVAAFIMVPRKSYVALIPFDADKTSSLTRFLDWLIAQGMGERERSI